MITDVAPPRPTGVFPALEAAIRTWRANPWSVALVLGVATIVWVLPWSLSRDLLKPASAGIWGSLLAIAEAVWWSPLLAVQFPFALALSRGRPPSAAQLWTGARRSGAIALILAVIMLPAVFVERMPTSPGDEFAWRDALQLAVSVALSYLFIRVAMAPILAVDEGGGWSRSLIASWRLTRGRFWSLLGFGLISFVALAVLYFLTGGRRGLMEVINNGTFYPVSCLAYARLYLAYARERDAEGALQTG